MKKKELRKLFGERRQTLTTAEVAEGSQAIARLFFSFFAIENLKAIHTYLPIRRQNEVDTFPIIYTIQEKYLYNQVVVPRALPETSEMEHYQWLPDMKLQLNKWGILEPDPTCNLQYAVTGIDLVILPLMAFDRNGYRVGYGRGFYDRFLVQCRPNVIKVGLSLFDPILKIDDIDSFDVQMDYCITPTQIWQW
ncbi:5-formyltetrahydrofolate cyclo-ligase [Runella salmonicolor]|uniref:5-formyltetrahydrofolate cyclo-ligase n=1 Tax=Runella salmonicolor TaxID=2950278 RepID=A0ABT1FM05_9BACT|nr:5-formyltetrahydrofolate cyclo-ligase [Runella salmonicolor]MCP1381588.1 5-formyltetrahydrofolate cyclo-ligase [Runella salmonicolor]